VVGIHDAALSQELQMDADLALEKETTLVHESEAIKKQQRTIRHTESAELNAVRGVNKTGTTKIHIIKVHHKHLLPSHHSVPGVASLHIATRNQCPAKDQTCHRCNKKGHFNKMCKTTGNAIRKVETEPKDDSLGTIHIDTTDTDNKENYWMTSINLNKQIVNFKIDTGADVTYLTK